jgi:PKD repeat protein
LTVPLNLPPPVANFAATPTSGAAPLTVSFTDIPSNSPTAWYWTFSDGGTSTTESPTYTFANPGAWTATLIASNAGGASSPFTQAIGVYDAFAWWQLNCFGSTNNNANTAPSADYTGMGMSNTNKFLAGFNPTNLAAYLHIISIAKANGTNIVVTFLGANGDNTYTPGVLSRTNRLEYTTGTPNTSYSNNFAQVPGLADVVLSGGAGTGAVTSVTDVGGATSSTTRYYRVRVLLP